MYLTAPLQLGIPARIMPMVVWSGLSGCQSRPQLSSSCNTASKMAQHMCMRKLIFGNNQPAVQIQHATRYAQDCCLNACQHLLLPVAHQAPEWIVPKHSHCFHAGPLPAEAQDGSSLGRLADGNPDYLQASCSASAYACLCFRSVCCCRWTGLALILASLHRPECCCPVTVKS